MVKTFFSNTYSDFRIWIFKRTCLNSICKFFLALFLFFSSQNFKVFAQVEDDFNFIIKKNPIIIVDHKKHQTFNVKETSETKLFFMGMIRLYQNFISSQQNHLEVCTFTPSCSRFGHAAINRYGFMYGILMASDRIQRCNGYSRKYYSIHPQTKKLYDPIESYYLKIGNK